MIIIKLSADNYLIFISAYDNYKCNFWQFVILIINEHMFISFIKIDRKSKKNGIRVLY